MFDRATPRLVRWALLCLAVWVVLDSVLSMVAGDGPFSQIQRYVYDGALVVAGALIALRATLHRGERLPWILLGAGCIAWALGDLWFTAAYWYADDVPVPSPADAGYLLMPPLAALAFVGLVRRRPFTVTAARRADGSTAAMAVAAVGAALVFDTVLEHAYGQASEVATNLAYPLGDLLLLGVIVGALASGGWALDRFWIVAGVGVLAFWIADSFYLVETANGGDITAAWYDAGWSMGIVLFAIAAWQPREVRPAGDEQLRSFVMPLVFASIALGLLVVAGIAEVSELAIALAAIALTGTMSRLVIAFRDNVGMLRASQREASTDALTGLGNRRALARSLASALDAGRGVVLALGDLDGFKHYNDTFGHPAGDALLFRLADRLSAAVEGRGEAFRMGGDEFCVVVDGDLSDVPELLAAVRVALSERGNGFAVGCSCGYVILPDEALEAQDALRLADQRLYTAKSSGRASAGAQSKDVLLRALVERSPDLEAHVTDVADLAEAVAARLGVPEHERAEVRHAAELHDVGKVAVPDAILGKPGPLDDLEWQFIRQHTIIGERILCAAPALSRVASIVRASHERWDGRGYPDGLEGEDIPLGARIVAVADAFDAMVADRPYRPAKQRDEAVDELRRCSGTQFDPAVVEAFVSTLKTVPATRARVRGGAPNVHTLAARRARRRIA